jgi:mRNA interferase MazF
MDASDRTPERHTSLPQKGHIFCTWLVTLTRESLVERAGVLSSTKLDQLAAALRLAQVE